MTDRTPALRIDADGVPCEVRLSARRRTLAIEVHAEPRVIVRAPACCPAWLIEARLAERSRWIANQIERFRRLGGNQPPPLRYLSGETHLYLGEPLRLEVIEARKAGVKRVAGTLQVAIPAGGGADRARRLLEAWYRAQAHAVFGEILAACYELWRLRDHPCPTLAIRKMRTRWGSLADRRRMTLNLALIRAPRACIEYVVVHELCHLDYRGHGPRFHGLMDRQLPDWRELKRRLESLNLL
jgi:hypothetical protein